jgi:hypothetical protein
MKSETRRLNKLTGASKNIAKRYKLTSAAAEMIDRAGQIHGQKSRAVQIAVEILWRTQRQLAKIPTDILQSPLTARTYKLPQRTVALIEALGREGSRRPTQEATKDMGIDDESSHPSLCSEVADGVTRLGVRLFREPDAGNSRESGQAVWGGGEVRTTEEAG